MPGPKSGPIAARVAESASPAGSTTARTPATVAATNIVDNRDLIIALLLYHGEGVPSAAGFLGLSMLLRPEATQDDKVLISGFQRCPGAESAAAGPAPSPPRGRCPRP